MSARLTIPDRPLPAEQPLRGGLRGMVVTALLCLLLFAALNAVLAGLGSRGGQSHLKLAWNRLDAAPEPVDWLALGDSFCLHDVLPSVLSSRLGGEALNCGTMANMTLLNVAWMIGDQCARERPPRQVVIVMAFSTWWTPSDRWTRQGLAAIPRPLSELGAFEPALPLSPLHRIEFFADRYVRLYSSNVTVATALRGMIYQRLAGRSFQTWTPPGQTAATSLGEQVASRSEAVDPADRAAGFIPLNPLPPAQQQALIDSAYAQIMEHEPAVAPENREALKVIGELADQHGFDVWLANGPLVREFYELPRAAAWFTALDQDLARLSATHDRLHHLPGYLLVERAEAMDMGHLLPVGARRYTGWLADAMVGAGAVAVEP